MYMWSINGVGLHVLPIVYVKYTWCVVCRPICGVYMVYTCCQYVNFVWITWFMLSMLISYRSVTAKCHSSCAHAQLISTHEKYTMAGRAKKRKKHEMK